MSKNNPNKRAKLKQDKKYKGKDVKMAQYIYWDGNKRKSYSSAYYSKTDNLVYLDDKDTLPARWNKLPFDI